MTLRKFECWQCHRRFEADDSSWVECPYCHSDNVDYAHFHLPKGLWKWGAGIAACAGLAYGLLSIDWGQFRESPEPQAVEEEQVDTARTIVEKTDTVVEKELGLKVSPTINIDGTPTFEDGSYTFTVSVKNAPAEGSFYVVALDHFDHKKVVARSDDGHFKNLPPSKADGGQYDFAVCSVNGDSLLCDPIPRAGFIPQQAVAQRMSKEKLQQLIDSYDDSLGGAGENSYIAPDCKLEFKGLPADAVGVPTNLWGVADKVDTGIWHVTVTHVDYDDMNRISKVVITVEIQS